MVEKTESVSLQEILLLLKEGYSGKETLFA
jgi:hypothetical protein